MNLYKTGYFYYQTEKEAIAASHFFEKLHALNLYLFTNKKNEEALIFSDIKSENIEQLFVCKDDHHSDTLLKNLYKEEVVVYNEPGIGRYTHMIHSEPNFSVSCLKTENVSGLQIVLLELLKKGLPIIEAHFDNSDGSYLSSFIDRDVLFNKEDIYRFITRDLDLSYDLYRGKVKEDYVKGIISRGRLPIHKEMYPVLDGLGGENIWMSK